MKTNYHETIVLIERLHRRYLDVIKSELDKLHIEDINNIQALILYNIADSNLTIGELTARGYYLGSNVSYNVKKMTENEYLEHSKSKHDKRSTNVKLSQKGINLWNIIDKMIDDHINFLQGTEISDLELDDANQTLKFLEKFWTDKINLGWMQ